MTIPTRTSPLRHLLTGAGAQFITLVISAVIGFLLTPYMIRTLGNRDYGIMVLVGTFTGWFGLMDLGLSGAVSRYVTVSFAKRDLEGCNSYANSAFFMYLGLGTIGLVISLAVATVARFVLPSEQDNVVIPVLIVLAGIGFGFDLPLRALAGLINGCMRQDRTSVLHLVGRIARAGTTVVILALGGRLVWLSVGGVLMTAALAVTWWLAARKTLPTFALSWKYVSGTQARSLLSYGGIAFVGRVAEAILFRLDGFVIAYFLALASVAHFSVATTLVSYFKLTMVAFTGWLLQWFTHRSIGRGEDAAKSLLIATRYTAFIGGFCLFGLVAWGASFIERWMGVAYLDAYPALVALSVGMFLRACQLPNLNLLLARAQHHLYVTVNVIEGVINLVLSIVLVRYWGLTGIAVGTMVASIVVNGWLFPVMCCRVTETSVRMYYGTWLRALLVVLIAVSIPWWLAERLCTPYYGRLLLVGAVSAAVYFTVVLAVGSSASERRRLWAACFQ